MLRSPHHFLVTQIAFIAFFLGSCGPVATAPTRPPSVQIDTAPESAPVSTEAARPPSDQLKTASVTSTPISTVPAVITKTTASDSTIEAMNPLTGLPVQDPALLELPALLVSISHFPVEARPQAGLSFAPYVFEIYITEGATRFLTTFYGQFPAPEASVVGDCAIRKEVFTQTKLLLGNRVWMESNANNIHEPWEPGIGGICVNLYDYNGTLLEQTTTDSNGYYGFNVEPGNYVVEFVNPPDMEFVKRDAGDEENDSDADPATGRSGALDITASHLDVDAGLRATTDRLASSSLAPAEVGPVRSGRMVYRHIAAFFPDSCLIYAFASPEVLIHLPQCAFVDHNIQGGGFMLDIDRLTRLARESKPPDRRIDYSGNIYAAEAPAGGLDASRLNVYIAWLNQSSWAYDPLYQSWWRYVDNADQAAAGTLHPEVDRLTGRQLHFENVIVLFAQHELISPTNLEIRMEQDWLGDALLFRDGRMYETRWSTVVTDEEIQSGHRRPIQFLYPDNKTPFPLKPGHTWILVVTPQTTLSERSAGEWFLKFSQPPGAK